ncbi:unnamed protein product [Urochloa decumbens]|uniref:CASP-like protein n=1 Tax=Urochloa decumbens TaxID=240449 RepID=A0ABC9A1H1_9POAL
MAMSLAIFITRAAVVAVSVAALVCALVAPEVNFTALMFLKGSLLVLQVWNVPMLGYDAARVFLHVPLPPDRVVFFALVVADWVATAVLFAAVSSSTAVLVFFRVDTRACGSVSPGPGTCSHWYVAAAALTLWAWFFNLVVAVLTGCLLVAAIDHGH